MTSMEKTKVEKLKQSKEVKETVADRLLQAVIDTGIESGHAKNVLVKVANQVAGVSPQAIYQWYNKGSTPTGELTALICRSLGMNVMWVLTGKGDSGNPHFNYDDIKPKYGGPEAKISAEYDDDDIEAKISSEEYKSECSENDPTAQQDTHNYNQTYSFHEKQHRDALGNAVHEGVKLGNAP